MLNRTERRRDGVRVVVLAAIAAAMVAFGVTSAGAAPATAGAARTTTITIATIPTDTSAQGFFAQYEGFFRRSGLDAKVVILADPTQLAAAVLSGSAQVVLTSAGGLALLKARNAPIRMVASGAVYRRSAPTTSLVSARGTRIRSAVELIGRTVAIDQLNSLPHLAMLKWLKASGVATTSVKFVEIPFAQMLAPLARGTVHAAVLPEPFLTLALNAGARRVSNVFDAVCSNDCLLTAWIARRDLNPTVAAQFRNAIQAASVWANKRKHRTASGIILSKYTPIDLAVIRKMTRAQFAPRLVPRLAQPWIDALAEFRVIPSSFPAIELVR